MRLGMWAGVLVLLGLLVFAGSAVAFDNQQGVASTNTSPTPVGGFTSFFINNAQLACNPGSATYALFACKGNPSSCRADSPTLLCTSPFDRASPQSCVVPATSVDWGINFTHHSCCTIDGACVDNFISSNYNVGISQTNIPVVTTTVFPPIELNQSKIAVHANGLVVLLVEEASEPFLYFSNTKGTTWFASFSVRSLVATATLPSNVSPAGINVMQPVIASNAAGDLAVAFVIRDFVSGTQSVYFSECAAAVNCSQVDSWSKAIPILDPALDTQGGVWRHHYVFPVMSVVGDSVHVLFSDADTNPFTRIPGIFHKFCKSFSDCMVTANWDSPLDGPDIIGGTGAIENGDAHAPRLARLNSGSLAAIWVDHSSPGSSSYSLFYSESSDTTGDNPAWGVPVVIRSLGNTPSSVFLAGGGNELMILYFQSFTWNAYRCADTCMNPSSWSSLAAQLAGLPTAYVVNYALVPSDVDPSKWIVLTQTRANASSTSQLMGLEHTTGISTAAHALSTPDQDTFLAGFADYYSRARQPLALFAGWSPNRIEFFTSNILDEGNTPPLVAWSADPNPDWSSDPPGAPLAEDVQFTVSDPDSEDQLYYSLALRVEGGSTEYSLVDFTNLNALQTGAFHRCTGTGFVSEESCDVNFSVYSPDSSYVAPDGDYVVVLRVQDSGGSVSEIVSANTINLDVSPLDVDLGSPRANSIYSPDSSVDVDFNVSGIHYLNSLAFRLTAQSSNGTWDLGTRNVVIAPGSLPEVPPLDVCFDESGVFVCHYREPEFDGVRQANYTFHIYMLEDGITNAHDSVNPVVIDFFSPQILSHTPNGSVNTAPTTITFRVQDISVPQILSVDVNGRSSAFSCVPNGNQSNCTLNTPSNLSAGAIRVVATMRDGQGNSGSDEFTFVLLTGSGCTGPECEEPDSTPTPDFQNSDGAEVLLPTIGTVVERTHTGDYDIPGLLSIPSTIVESFNTLSRAAISTAEDLVEVTGPSAHAIFLGLCVLAALASDAVFRRIFTQIQADLEKQRERMLRTVLAGIFFALPAMVGWQFSLPLGFVFAVLEIVGFLAAGYVYKVIQYHQVFGFKPVPGVK